MAARIAVAVFHHMGHADKHPFLEGADLGIVFLEHLFQAHITFIQHIDVVMYAGFVFYLEHVHFLVFRKWMLRKLNLVVPVPLLEFLFRHNHATGHFPNPDNKQAVQPGIIAHLVVYTAICQRRESLTGLLVTAEIVKLRSYQHKAVRIPGFQILRNKLFHIVALDPKADIEQGELCKHIHRRHYQGVVLKESRGKKREDRNHLDQGKGNKTIERDVFLFQKSIDNKAHVTDNIAHHQAVENGVSNPVHGGIVTRTLNLDIFDGLVVKIVETYRQ